MMKFQPKLPRTIHLLAILCCMIPFHMLHAQFDLTISPEPSFTSRNNASNIAAAGNSVHIVYTEGNPGNEQVYYSHFTERGNALEDIFKISGDWQGVYPAIAVFERFVHVVFFSPLQASIFYTRSQDNGVTWEAPVHLTSQAEGNSYPSLTVNGSILHLVWENDWADEIMYKSSMDGGSSWSADVMLSESGSEVTHPSIVASDTHVHLIYQVENGVHYRQSMNNGVDWSPLTMLAYEGEQPSITVSENLVMVIWMDKWLRQIHSVRSINHGDTWEDETMPVENYTPIKDAKIVSYGNFFYLVWSEIWDTYSIYTAISTDGGTYFTNYGPSTFNDEEAFSPHAIVEGQDVHLIWTEYREGNNQEIVYLQNKGLNPMARANEYEWGFGYGNLNSDSGEAIAVDDAGNVYVAGYFSRTIDFDPSPAVVNKTSKGSYDIFIAKYNQAGQFMWVHSIGGSQGDVASYLCLDQDDNVYVTGYFNDVVDFDPTSGVLMKQAAGKKDVYILKLDTDGNFIWAQGLGGLADDIPGPVKVDALGRIISVGYFSGEADFDPGPDQKMLTSTGSTDIYVTILDSNGMLVKALSVGGPGADLAYGVSISSTNSIYVTGHFVDSVDFDPGPGVQWHYSKGNRDFYILRLDADAQWEWSATLGSIDNDTGTSIEIDQQGNVIVVGEINEDADMDPGPGEYYLSENGFGHSIFILRLDSLGQFRWAKGFQIYDFGFTRMKLDSIGCIYLFGSFQIINLPSHSDVSVQSEGQDDVLMMKIDTSGHWMWINPLRSSGYAIARDIALEGLTGIIVTGHFSNDLDLDPSTGVDLIYMPSGNFIDIYVAKSSQCIPKRATQASTVCGRYKAPDGETFYNSGTYRIVIPAVDGCDSVITLHLTVLLNSPITRDTVIACEQFTTPSGDFTWTHSGLFYEVLTNAVGCDSFVLYRLTIVKHSDPTNVNVTACNSYTTPDGLYMWTASGMYEAHYVNMAGCDSLIIYQLEINQDHSFQYAVSTCDPYTTPDGMQTWDASGIYSYQLMTSTGCDSFITVDLAITDINLEVMITDSILMAQQEGGTYQWFDCNNGEALANETNQVLKPTNSGLYAAIITLNDCQDTTDCIPFTTVSNKHVASLGDFRFFPNPVDDVIYFDHNHFCEKMTVTFMDLVGRILFKQDVADCHTLELPYDLSSGIYLVKIFMDDKEGVIRVVVE